MSSFADEIIPLGMTGDYINGLGFKEADWSAEGLPIIRIQNLTNSAKPLNRTLREVDNRFKVQNGDILVSWSATLDAFIWRRGAAVLNQHIFKVVPDTARVDPGFLFYQLKRIIWQMSRGEHAHGSTIKHINRKPFLQHPFWCPTLSQQREIALRLDRNFSGLENSEKQLLHLQGKLKQARASILKAAVEGRLVELEGERPSPDGATYLEVQDFVGKLKAERKSKLLKGKRKENGKMKLDSPFAKSESIDLLPKGWTMLTVNDLCWDSGYGTSVKCTHEAEGDPVLRIPNIAKGKLDLANIKKTAKKGGIAEDDMITPGDFLFVRTNGSLSILGAGCVILSEPPFPMSYASYLIRLRVLGSPATWKWFQLVWTSSLIRRNIESSAASSAGQNNLSLSKVLSFELPIPPESEIHRILEIVDRRISVLDQVEATVQASLARCVMLRQAILKRAFEGRLVPAE